MCPIPRFTDDIFISYAHIDNQPLAEGLRGWVESLHESLKIRLGQLLGEEASIWRDRKLRGNDAFADELVEKVTSVAILVSVISPRYVKSEWCLRELEEFCKRDWTDDGRREGNRLPVFKVIKTFVPVREHPHQLQGVLGYEFFEYDSERGRAKEFSPEVSPQRDIRFWEKLDDLAYDIKQLIEEMKQPGENGSGENEGVAHEPAKTVYLAETTSDLAAHRDQIKRELQHHGHTILPDGGLPLLDASALKHAVEEYLSRSDFSVHLIGERYGIVPEGEEKSVVHIQAELAAARGEEFTRLVWMPVGLQSQEGRQQAFINGFLLGQHAPKGTEVLQTKLEDLKTVIHEVISRDEETEPEPRADASDEVRVSLYLICDKEDFADADVLADYLFEQGVDVILPATEGDEAQVYEDHKANLLECDAALVYYGRANEIWLRMKLRELQKVAGYGRAAPLLAKAIYVGAPRTDAKERLRDHAAVIVKNYEAFSPESLRAFLAQLSKDKGARR